MQNHNHCGCNHVNIKYCIVCNVTYCADCGQEWGNGWNYPSTYYPSFPIFTSDPSQAWCGTTDATQCIHQ